MLVTIQQTKSNFENLFEVSSNGHTLFNATAPWMKISTPFNVENIRKLTFSNEAGEPLYTTRYNIIDNALEESVPFKYLITKPLTVIDNLDVYYMHIKEVFTALIPILSFFTIYYDYRNYNNAGKLTKNSVECRRIWPADIG